MAGPYDVEGLGVYDLNDSRKMVYPPFLAFIADSYSKIYNLDLSKIVVRYDVFKNINLFGGDYSAIEINALLGLADLENGDYGFNTHYPDELFLKSFIDDFETNPNNIFRVKLRENNVYNWKPNMPTQIINCVDDEIIPFFIAQKTYDTMKNLGANVTLIPIETSNIPPATQTTPFVHQRCISNAYSITAQFFNALR